MHQDHDSYDGYLGNFRVLDNTNYPNTLNPTKRYEKDTKSQSQLIIGFPDRHDTALSF